MDLFKIGAIIQKQRQQQNLSQAALAAAAGVSRLTVNLVENGKAAELGVRKLERLLNVLGLELSVRDHSPTPTLDELIENSHRRALKP